MISYSIFSISFFFFFLFTQDQKVRLFDWDGKSFKEIAILEANKGLISALAFSPDGLKLAAGDVSTFLYFIFLLIMAQFHPPKKKRVFNSVCMCVRAPSRERILYFTTNWSLATFFSYQTTVQWKSHPLRRSEARIDHLPLGLPFGAGKLVELDRGLTTLRLWSARYAHIRLERPEAPQEHSDQERRAWGCQCGALVVQRQVGGGGCGRSDQDVGGKVARVRRLVQSSVSGCARLLL